MGRKKGENTRGGCDRQNSKMSFKIFPPPGIHVLYNPQVYEYDGTLFPWLQHVIWQKGFCRYNQAPQSVDLKIRRLRGDLTLSYDV